MWGADGIRPRRTCPSLGPIGGSRTSDRSAPLPDALPLALVLLHELGHRRVFHLVHREPVGLERAMAAHVVCELRGLPAGGLERGVRKELDGPDEARVPDLEPEAEASRRA